MSRSNFLSFLYPVLREGNDDYIDESFFRATYSIEIIGSELPDTCKLNFSFEINNPYLQRLYDEGRIVLQLDSYCGETLFHELINCEQEAGEFIFPAGAINGRLELQAILVTNEKIDNFSPERINNEFQSSIFALDRGSIVAFEPGAIFEISNEFTSFQDIIRVQTSEELDVNEYAITLQSNVITVNMGLNVRKSFEIMKADAIQKPHLFASIYKDTFVEALMALPQEEFEEFTWVNKLKERVSSLKLNVSDMQDYSKANRAALLILGKKSYEKMAKDDI